MVAFLNIGWFNRQRTVLEGRREAEFYTLPLEFIRDHHRKVESGWEKVHTRKLDLSNYLNDKGFELIAQDLGIPYPSRD